METSAAPRGRILSIQYLRAISALLVFAYHSAYRGGDENAFFVGQAGVDVFFVISGFVMWTVTDTPSASPLTFVAHRLARIVPLYWAVTLFYVAVGVVSPGLYPWARLDIGEVVKSLLFIPYISQMGQFDPVVAPGWTLNLEMFFYALLAVSLWIPRRIRLAFLTIILGGAVAMHFAMPSASPLSFYSRSIVLEFLAGAFVGHLWSSGRTPGPALGLLCLLLGAGGLAATQILRFEPGELRTIFWGPSAVLMVLGGLGIEAGGRLPRLPLLESLGDASYSLYLVHSMVLAATFKLLGPGSLRLFLVALVPLCVVSVLSYRLFERPIYSALRRAASVWSGPRRAAQPT
jgi:exopolysaccharide production protein ExoZ